MKNKNGFTLVELLAVIAILAILVIIALPNVLKMYRQARENSFENEVKNLYNTAQNQFVVDSLSLNQGENIAYTNSEETIEGVSISKPLNITGGANLKYYILMSNEGKVLNIRVTNGTYSYAKQADDINSPISLEDIDIHSNNDIELESNITNEIAPESEDTYIYPDPTDVSCFTYTTSNNEVTITNFNKCTTDVVIPKTIANNPVVAIGSRAFRAKNLISVVIPNTVTTLSEKAFADNYSLASVTLGNHIVTIGDGAFYGNIVTSITLPNTVTSIGYQAFYASGLTSITIPNSVTSIGEEAFRSSKLTSVTLPNNITTISKMAFSDNKITSVKIPNSVITIEDDAFYRNKLSSLTLGSGVTTIGVSAFATNQLPSLTIPSNVTTIEHRAFEENLLTSVTVPDTVTTLEYAAFNYNLLPDNQAYFYKRTDMNNDGIAEIDYTTLISYGGANKHPSIPNGVTTIGRAALFRNQLTSVTIPNTVVSIGNEAFELNSLTSVTIPSSVTAINDSAFYSNKLTSVTIQGKTSSSQFSTYSPNWGWKSGITCTKNNTSNVTNGCITWGA